MKECLFKGYDLNRCSAVVLSKLCYSSFYDYFLGAAYFAVQIPFCSSFHVCLLSRYITSSYYLRITKK